MLLDALEALVDLLPSRSSSLPALAGALALVVPLTERAEVGIGVVTAWDDVIYLSGDFRTANASFVMLCAAATVALQDVIAQLGPVRRQT